MSNAGAPGAGPEDGAFKIEPNYYPIVYVRGYAMTAGEREETFHDAYYGFGVTSVERRDAAPPDYSEVDLFEGLLIRLIKDHDYADATNDGLHRREGAALRGISPARGIWVSRFYDRDVFKGTARQIEEHAADLYDLVVERIPAELKNRDVDPAGYKVILLAHSMGGLVCRTLIQNLLPERGKDPRTLIHRLVTMGTPHRGIDLGTIPDFIEDRVVSALNPFGSAIFKEARMRAYLNLAETKSPGGDDFVYDIHSLGRDDAFPVGRCLCLIGSDWNQYNLVKTAVGGTSDGLVKQSNAYIVAGRRDQAEASEEKDRRQYDPGHVAFWANVHRAHSGRRGIVNSYESYENIQRFLFGDTRIRLDLEDVAVMTDQVDGDEYFYDLGFALSIRNTATYLHRRQQDPCENAHRFFRRADGTIPGTINLHTGFMNSKRRAPGSPYSQFLLKFSVDEFRVASGFIWDREYPARSIYRESLEARVDDEGTVGYRWLSDVGATSKNEGWKKAALADGTYRIPFRKAKSFMATLVVSVGPWPDPQITQD